MNLTYVPLLQQERDLYRRPRDYKRFKAYLHLTLDMEKERVKLPLLGMNPMAQEHVAEYLDTLLAFEADRVAEEALRDAAKKVRDIPGSFRVALVVHDDLKGGWTNRAAGEYEMMRCAPAPPGQSYLDWLGCVLWVTDPPTAALVRNEVFRSICRAGYISRHGSPQTLREMMIQEGQVMVDAGCTPTLDDDDLEYSRWVIEPFLEATDMRTAVECLFGDAIAKTLGFTPRGLSRRAGLALALHDALKTCAT